MYIYIIYLCWVRLLGPTINPEREATEECFGFRILGFGVWSLGTRECFGFRILGFGAWGLGPSSFRFRALRFLLSQGHV